MDRFDVLALAGLGLTSWGLFLWWPPLAAIWPGLLLTALGLLGGARKGR